MTDVFREVSAHCLLFCDLHYFALENLHICLVDLADALVSC